MKGRKGVVLAAVRLTREETTMFLGNTPGRARLVVFGSLILAAACGADPSAPTMRAVPAASVFAKSTSTNVNLSGITPDSASLLTTLDVQISGSGFQDGMVAAWQLNGVSEPTQVKTNSTRYLSAKQLVANITISGTATVAQWDVSLYLGGKTGVGSEVATLKQGFKVVNPTDTWKVPLNASGLAFRSDGRYSDGTYSVYADGVCNVGGTMNYVYQNPDYAGDMLLNTGIGGGKCSRAFTFVFPDGYTETIGAYNNLRGIESATPTYSIPIGQTVKRQLHLEGQVLARVSSRCDGLVFGYGVMANVGAGSDSVLVTRVDVSTWRVFSQPAPHNLAYCHANGQLYAMPVDFLVVSSRALP
jgi:hypothetical protein